jgi:hypothetical protein
VGTRPELADNFNFRVLNFNQPPAQRDSIAYPLKDFVSINVGAGARVKVIRDDKYLVAVTGDKSAVASYFPVVRNNTLQLQYTGTHGNLKSSDDFQITVRMPRLHSVDLNGRTESVISGFTADSLYMHVSGKSKARVTSNFDYAWIMVSGSSTLSGFGLNVDYARINVSADSECEFTVTKSIKGNVSNGGRVRYKGQVKPDVEVSRASIMKVE